MAEKKGGQNLWSSFRKKFGVFELKEASKNLQFIFLFRKVAYKIKNSLRM